MIIDISMYVQPVVIGIDGCLMIYCLYRWSVLMKREEGKRFKKKRLR